MAIVLIWEDDFDTYANQAAVEARYHYGFNESVTGFQGRLVTPGPDGYSNGVDALDISVDYGGNIEVSHWDISPCCRCFHVRGVWQIDTVDTFNAATDVVRVSHTAEDGSDFYGLYVSLQVRIDDLTALQVVVNADGSNVSSGYMTGLLTPNAANQIDVEGFISSGPGVGDGSVSVSVNGVEVYSYSGVVAHTFPVDLRWNTVEIDQAGTFSGLRIWSCDETETPGAGDYCPCITPTPPGDTPPGVPNDNEPPNQFPTIGQQLVCIGGGLVPTQADLVPSELWWGL